MSLYHLGVTTVLIVAVFSRFASVRTVCFAFRWNFSADAVHPFRSVLQTGKDPRNEPHPPTWEQTT